MKDDIFSDTSTDYIKIAFKNLFFYIFSGASFLVLCGFLSEQSRLHFLGLNKIVSTSLEDYTIEGVEFFAKHISFLFIYCILICIPILIYHFTISINIFKNTWLHIVSIIAKNKFFSAVFFIFFFLVILYIGFCIYKYYIFKLIVLDSILFKEIKMPYNDSHGTRFYIVFLMLSTIYSILVVKFTNCFKNILGVDNIFSKIVQTFMFVSLISLLALCPAVFSRTVTQASYPVVEDIVFSETFKDKCIRNEFNESIKNEKLFLIDKKPENIIFFIKDQKDKKRIFVIRNSDISLIALISAKNIL